MKILLFVLAVLASFRLSAQECDKRCRNNDKYHGCYGYHRAHGHSCYNRSYSDKFHLQNNCSNVIYYSLSNDIRVWRKEVEAIYPGETLSYNVGTSQNIYMKIFTDKINFIKRSIVRGRLYFECGIGGPDLYIYEDKNDDD